MNEQLRHFVAYHNTKKMGRALHDDDPLRILTRKPVKVLVNNVVWIVVGESTPSLEFLLGSVFVVNDIGEAVGGEFTSFARGPGYVFDPPVPIREFEWFPSLFKAVGHFGLGVQEVKDNSVIDGLLELASAAGYTSQRFESLRL